MNSVHLIGRLATDVDVKEVNGGSKVSTFILAVDRNAEEADFFRIKAWNSQAEAAGAHLGKGRRIAVEGSLRQDVYEKDGEERKAVSVVAKRLEYLTAQGRPDRLGAAVGGSRRPGAEFDVPDVRLLRRGERNERR